MQGIVNKIEDKWLHPWDIEKHDNLYNRDDRFFSILAKGVLGWLTRNIVLYGKPIKHFIFNTGSSVMYIESNGYEFKWNETTGEDWIYHEMPRCVCEFGNVSVPQEELSNPFVRGTYERRSGDDIVGYNAEIRRLPIELNMHLKYVLSNTNESLILMEELINKLVFQRYFNITYLGQIIECSLEHDGNQQVEFNKIDMSSQETNQKIIDFDIRICSNYPIVNERSECNNKNVMASFGGFIDIHRNIKEPKIETQKYRISVLDE
ncbi:MAG: hypothetical protein J6D03_11435 [Clostridia bacterium]|nr:hypothetical protein [Clostridia bacterium]MBO5005797.1 hypothetical protein [Clostridia bacterium]